MLRHGLARSLSIASLNGGDNRFMLFKDQVYRTRKILPGQNDLLAQLIDQWREQHLE
jgi:hypothetical protein